MQLANRRCK